MDHEFVINQLYHYLWVQLIEIQVFIKTDRVVSAYSSTLEAEPSPGSLH